MTADYVFPRNAPVNGGPTRATVRAAQNASFAWFYRQRHWRKDRVREICSRTHSERRNRGQRTTEGLPHCLSRGGANSRCEGSRAFTSQRGHSSQLYGTVAPARSGCFVMDFRVRA